MVVLWLIGLYSYPYVCQIIAHIGPNDRTEKKFQILPIGLTEHNISFSLIKIKILGVPFVTQQ